MTLERHWVFVHVVVRTVEKKTQSRTTAELPKTGNIKKDPLFEQMVEQEQHRWLAEVKKIEDKRKEVCSFSTC